MTINSIYRGDTKQYRFEFKIPNPDYTGEPPLITVTTAATGDYDHITYPLDISSTGVVTEDWTLTFTSATEYNIEGTTAGAVGEGNKTVDATPNNPVTNTPYFTLAKGGWVANKVFEAGDTVTFSTVAQYVPENITDLVITMTFIEEGATVAALEVSTTAGDDPTDEPVDGIVTLTLASGETQALTAEKYIYGFERRLPHVSDADLDVVKTIEKGTVKVIVPAKGLPTA
jgi:hypothetical protein